MGYKHKEINDPRRSVNRLHPDFPSTRHIATRLSFTIARIHDSKDSSALPYKALIVQSYFGLNYSTCTVVT